MSKEISEYVNIPRSLYNRFPMGSALGQPNNREQHKQVLNKALDLLVEAKEGGIVEESGIKYK
ncbi:hypothetical protein [Anaerobacillus sp. 1_MG-2023]|uniref:hypothetical protein n=1 Tax=Anaerobacillus sp. 1_MG-2023 TaxID=3062655 RepID=UPI001884647C|nr:hypothetical protein [Anaerobacillus sp. 1_MG-2023]MBF0708083.1 hypothetical protein [Pseudalkalibacillus hwajinpoensis]MDO6658580.1 hypothetical protein [Anaerobacillus sp. 1_MG-2023]